MFRAAVAFTLIMGCAGSVWLLATNYTRTVQENTRLTTALAEAEEAAEEAERDAKEAAARRDTYFTELQKAEKANADYENCITDGTCVPTVGVLPVPSDCPTSTPVPDRPRTEAVTARLSPAAQRADSRLAKQIALNRVWELKCMTELAACAVSR